MLFSRTNYPDTKLWQIQVEHDARPSISINIIQSLNDYLKGSAGLPDNVQKLQTEVCSEGRNIGGP